MVSLENALKRLAIICGMMLNGKLSQTPGICVQPAIIHGNTASLVYPICCEGAINVWHLRTYRLP